MKISDNVYQQLMSQAADKMTELYDKVKSRDDELATLRAQLAEAREGLTEANEIMSVVRHENMQPYRNWVDKYYKHLVNTD